MPTPTGPAIGRLLRDPRLTIFAFCIGAFHLASAAMLPLAADLSDGTRRCTLCLSSLSIPVAIGASLSTTLAGLVADRAGDMAAFLGLGLVGLGGVALLWRAMPETGRPETGRPETGRPETRITAARPG